jgi:hypothetical protein
MEDVIAVEVRLADGTARYYVTWGRIQDPVDTGPVTDLVMAHATLGSLGGEPVSANVCPTLRVAAESAQAPYFFEALVQFSRQTIPGGDEYDSWRRERAEAMANGREIYYCGRPE